MESCTRLEWPPNYTFRRSRKAKRLIINLCPKKGIELVVPYRVSQAEALAFLESRRYWIEQHAHWLPTQRQTPREFPDTLTLPFLGKQWAISLLPDRPVKKPLLREDIEHLVVVSNVAHFCKDAEREIIDWLKRKAQQTLGPLIAELSDETQLPYRKLTIRHQKTLWGSCSRQGDISLNVKLLFFPYEVVRYVVIHELAHTRFFNHSANFWQLVAQFVPDYHQHKYELRMAERYLPEWLL